VRGFNQSESRYLQTNGIIEIMRVRVENAFLEGRIFASHALDHATTVIGNGLFVC